MHIYSDITSRAMLLHHCKSSGAIDLTVHNIVHDDVGDPLVGAGRVLGAEEKTEIAGILTADATPGFSLQDPRTLAQSSYAIAWWEPKAKREIMFRSDANISRHTVMFPNMVGVYIRGTLHFAVTKGGKNARPDADTPLYRIPLPNLFSGGSFCRGNANIPTYAKASNIPAWNAFVFDTFNTHMGEQALKNAYDMDETIEAYAQMEKQGGRFAASQLISMDITLGEWMNQLDKKGGL